MYTVQIEPTPYRTYILGFLLLLAIIALTALLLPLLALILSLLLLGMGALFVARQMRSVARSVHPSAEAMPTPLRLELADGTTLQARPVPMPHRSEYTLMLTRQGYMLVNAEGAVSYRL